jgi:membrane protease YdiL (CAAX protease family)
MKSLAPPRPVSRALRRREPWVSLMRALLVVPWMLLWIIPIVAALAMPVEWATMALVALGMLFVWWNVVRPLRSRPRMAASLRLRPWRHYAGWLTLAAVAQFVLAFATLVLHEQLAAWRFLPKLPSAPELIPPDFFTHALGPVAMVLAVVVITPLVEEFGCRGRMQYRLEQAFGVVPAILIPAVIFSLLHGLLVGPHHLAFALFVGWVVWRTGSIWTAVYVHALNNAAVLGLLYLTRDRAIYSQEIPPWLWPYAIAGGVMALGSLLAAAYRIQRIAQQDRPRAGVWTRRRPVDRGLTAALRG